MMFLIRSGVLFHILRLILAVMLTIMLECLAAFFIGFRKKQSYAVITCVDCITNPIVNALFVVACMKIRRGNYIIFVAIALEVMVVFIEKQFFAKYIDYNMETRVFRGLEFNRKALLTSGVLNLVSVAPGSFLFRLIVDHIV